MAILAITRIDAQTRMEQLIDWFRNDLAYTAPELYEVKWDRFKIMMDDLIDDIFNEDE